MRRTPSERRRKRDRGYAKARQAVYDRADGRCEINATWRCSRQAEQIHHIAGRGGPDPHRLNNLLACCDHCHSYVHDRPAEAYAAGWMVRRNGMSS